MTRNPGKLTQEQLTRAVADMGRHYAAILYGAGASKTSLVPLAGEIVIDLCRDSYCEASGIPLANREYVRATDVRQWLQMQDWYAKSIERGESEYSAVFRQFKPTNDHQIGYVRNLVLKAKPAPVYDGLAHLVQAGVFDISLTTNFDPLLENRYKSIFPVEILNVLKADHDFQFATTDSGRRHLAYLHGSLDGYSIANLDEDTRRLSDVACGALARLLDGYALVIAGYSGQDTSVMGLLLRLAKTYPSCFRRGVIYWCHLPGHKLSALAEELLGLVAQGFMVEVYGFDHLIGALCRRTAIGTHIFENIAPSAELSTTGRLLPDQAILNITPAVKLPDNMFKFRTGLKSDEELRAFRDKYSYWQAAIRDNHLWLLGNPDELPKALQEACSLRPEPISLNGLMNDDIWRMFAQLTNAGLHHWITENLGLRAWGKKNRHRYFFNKLPDRDERVIPPEKQRDRK